MKDVFRTRLSNEFFSLLSDFVDSMRDTFPDCVYVQTWCTHATETLLGEGVERAAFMERFRDRLMAPVPRGQVKYDRAVQSITKSPLCTYQLLRYRDVRATMAMEPSFAELSLEAKIPNMQDEDRRIFWQYVDELCNVCFRYFSTTAPRVPTASEISANIEMRRQSRTTCDAGRSSEPPAVSDGLSDLWTQLCDLRGVKITYDPTIQSRLMRDAALCKDSDDMVRIFSELGDAPYDARSMALVERIRTMASMTNAIPANMMRGIERVAADIVDNINRGTTDLSSVDIESIGQRVLRDVSDDDVGAFATNLDKIIPALEKMGGGIEH